MKKKRLKIYRETLRSLDRRQTKNVAAAAFSNTCHKATGCVCTDFTCGCTDVGCNGGGGGGGNPITNRITDCGFPC